VDALARITDMYDTTLKHIIYAQKDRRRTETQEHEKEILRRGMIIRKLDVFDNSNPKKEL